MSQTTEGRNSVDPPDQPDQPVSTQVTRIVSAAKVAEFERLLHELLTVAQTFEGHLGVDVLRPETGGTYLIIFRYRSHAEYQVWLDSEPRERLVGKIDELLDDSTEATVRTIDGWEGWFVNPGYAPPAPPQRWKMAVITLGALYPIVLLLTLALGPLTGGWPLPLAMLLTMVLTIPLMTWTVMPAVTTRLGPWLRR